jgi:hypothetical protein
MQVRWYGHSAFAFVGPGGAFAEKALHASIFVDPFDPERDPEASAGFDYPPIRNVQADLVLVPATSIRRNTDATGRLRSSRRSHSGLEASVSAPAAVVAGLGGSAGAEKKRDRHLPRAHARRESRD